MLHCVSSFAVFFFDGIGLKCVLGVLAVRAVAWNQVPDNDQIGTRPAACSFTVLDTSSFSVRFSMCFRVELD